VQLGPRGEGSSAQMELAKKMNAAALTSTTRKAGLAAT
jgi:hypothetical protein